MLIDILTVLLLIVALSVICFVIDNIQQICSIVAECVSNVTSANHR